MKYRPFLIPSLLIALALLTLGVLAACGQPVPQPSAKSIEDQVASSLLLTTAPTSQANQLSAKYLAGTISPSYYSNAVRQVLSSNALTASVKLAKSMNNPASAGLTVVVPPPAPITNGLVFSNHPTAQRIAIGQNGWNVQDTNGNTYYPAYSLLSSKVAKGQSNYTVVSTFIEGSRGFTNNFASTNPQGFFMVKYAQ